MDKDALMNSMTDMFVAPMLKTNKLTVVSLEKLVAFQMSSLQSYVDLTLGQMKAAAAVSNVQELQGFVKAQMEMAAALRQKMLDDVKALTDLGNGLKDDFTKLAEENVADIKAKTEKAVKKAA